MSFKSFLEGLAKSTEESAKLLEEKGGMDEARTPITQRSILHKDKESAIRFNKDPEYKKLMVAIDNFIRGIER